MDDIAAMDKQSNTLMAEFRNLSDSGKMTEADMNRIRAAYDKVFTDFIAVNPESPALAYAISYDTDYGMYIRRLSSAERGSSHRGPSATAAGSP